MEAFKSGFGLFRALVPVLYCGGLAYYFLDVGGSVRGAWTIGLGPTVLGLGAVSLLFCIPLILKVRRILAGQPPPGSVGRGGWDGPARDDDNGFDADAAIARYMASRFAETGPSAPAAPARGGAGAGRRPGFGRRSV